MKHVFVRIATACLSFALLTVAAPPGTASAQRLSEPVARAKDHLKANHKSLGLTARDIAEAVVKNQRTSPHNGVTDVSLQQQLDGIDVFAGVTKVNIARDGSILGVSNRFVSDLASKARVREPKLSAAAAVVAAARALGLESGGGPQPKEQIGGPSRKVVFAPSGLSKRDIPVRLVYLKRGNGVRLAWDLAIETDQEHYWQVQVDAVTGLVLQQKNYVLNHSYRVYPIPAESPNHVGILPPADGRTLVFNPETRGGLASPAGWVTPGLLTTDGPNVQAQTDLDANDAFTPGTDVKPLGTGLPTALTFDFAIDLTKNATTYREALVTNLFYWNNVNHDVHELYGFDEANFNFEGNDPVLADAQDGSGTNNANMLTLPEGVPPRMQMYLFTPPADLRVNSPYAALYNAGTAGFGQPLNETGVTGDLALVNDGAGTTTTDACEPPPWASNVTGKIALLDRGTCEFSTKILHAQQAGAIAAVMVNIQSDDPISMSAGVDAPQVTISSISIGNANGNELKAVIASSIVNVTMRAGSQPSRDSDFDNGVITHEYGHGVSNRLAGDGVDVPFCLDGDQQAGEGWSDWWALAFTQATGTEAPAGRGIATYSLFQATTGSGFRPFRYSTDMSINPQTYGDLTEGTLSVPHGVGTVWATAAWDMYWALVRGVPAPFNLPGRGFEPDIYQFASGKGNTIALQLMIDGLKLGGCAPNMLTTRDAILLADTQNNGGANQCHIWWAFARRGMGVNAMSNGTTLDVTEDFSLPLACQPPGPCAIPPFFTGIDRVEAPVDGTCRLVVEWSAARDNCETGQIRYNLYRSTNPLFVPNAASLLASNLTALEYTDTSVQSGVEYFYIARAHDGLGNSEQNLARRSNRPVGGFSADPNGLTDDAGDTEQHFASRAGQTGWTVRSAGGVGGSKVHATSASGNYRDDSCLYLESDIVHLGASSTLAFQTAWAIEPGWDGGIVEISTEAGGFSDWTKLDDVLYPGAMAGPVGNTSCSNPGLSDGERVFTGSSNGNFLGFTSELAAWANQSVRVRFVFGSDASTNDTGWLIDNITIDDVRAAEPCTTNNPPDAVDDTAATTSGTPVTVNVLANDTDAEGDTLSVTSVSDPPNGTAVRNADNTVTYTSDGNFAGNDSFTYTASDGRGSDTATVRITVTAPNRPDLVVSSITVNNNKNVKEGDKVTIRATVSNTGNAPAAASQTEFRLDNTTTIGLVATQAVAAGSSTLVTLQWDTRSVKGQHVITVTADKGTVVTESNEGNNTSTVTVNVQGNKTKNSSFEQGDSSGTAPEGWSGESTGGGNAAWSEGGSDGSMSAGASGNGGNAARSGSPTWTSDPISVTSGEALTFAVSVSSVNASSAATAGLVYLGAAGNVLSTVNLITAPLTTAAFTRLEKAVTVPAGVSAVRVKLIGFSPTDLRTSGTVRFDEVGLFGN
jgi:extracellular elastinolytic metalloproteinase